jgi:hypothetical protein
MGEHVQVTPTQARRPGGRGMQAGRDMLLSLGLVGAALVIWMLLAHPRTPAGVLEVDWIEVAQAAAESAEFEVLAPAVALGWPATSARVEAQPDGTQVWRAGFLTEEGKYAALLQRGVFPEQAAASKQLWIADETRRGRDAGSVLIAGQRWTQLEGESVPDERRSLLREADGTVTLVTGSASWGELEHLAEGLRPLVD